MALQKLHQTKSVVESQSRMGVTKSRSSHHLLEEMQSLYGNRAVNRLLEGQGTEPQTALPIQRKREEMREEDEEMPNPVQRLSVGAGQQVVGMGTDEVGMRGVNRENRTGLPDNLKAGIEHLSGYSMDDVRVHYNSPKPAELNALAYTQGTEIHVAPGQEEHLPHEAWHVVQQMQGRVKPTMQINGGIRINDDPKLEQESDVMGRETQTDELVPVNQVLQRVQWSVQLPEDTTIQRQIVGKDEINRPIWASEIAGCVFKEKDRDIATKIHRLHSIRRKVQVSSYRELVKNIKAGKYTALLKQSMEDNVEGKYNPLQPAISYPEVPKDELDPRVRVNVMIREFNRELETQRRQNQGRPNHQINNGLLMEICTAIKLINDYAITSGRQISRGLTEEEKKEGRSGDEQKILTQRGVVKGGVRELDLIGKGELNAIEIIEVKNLRSADTHQVENNVDLANEVGGRAAYAVHKSDTGTYQKALEHASKGENITRTIPIEDNEFGTLYNQGKVIGLATIPTEEDIMDENFNPDIGDERDESESDAGN